MTTAVTARSAVPSPTATRAAITGWSIHLPAVAGGVPGAKVTLAESCPADQAHTVLGRKGLLYKEPATRLALCAVHRALGLPDGGRPQWPLDPDTAVVAASNLGNVATVVEVCHTVAAQGGRAVSPMAAPNASSNVLASSVALWFRFGGPNVMVCSGATAGLDAITLASRLIRARRARRVVVVGAEPDDPVATAVHALAPDAVGAHQKGASVEPAAPRPLRTGAACVILERPDVAEAAAWVDLASGTPSPPPLTVGPGGVDVAQLWGDLSGAQGVLQVALAAQLLANGETGPAKVRCGNPVDGWATVQVAV